MKPTPPAAVEKAAAHEPEDEKIRIISRQERGRKVTRIAEEFLVRCARPDDITELIHLQRQVYPPPYPRSSHWTKEEIHQHLIVFPEGQFCVEYLNDGTIVGSAVTMRTRRVVALKKHTFASITGNRTLKTHDPAGNALYGIDICVAPHFRGKGLAGALYRRRFQLMRELGLAYFLAGARIPGFRPFAGKLKVEDYVEKVVKGEVFDPTLSVQIKKGFRVVAILPKYMADPDSDNVAVLIEYEEPEEETTAEEAPAKKSAESKSEAAGEAAKKEKTEGKSDEAAEKKEKADDSGAKKDKAGS